MGLYLHGPLWWLQQRIGEVVGSGHRFPAEGDAGLGVEMGVFCE